MAAQRPSQSQGASPHPAFLPAESESTEESVSPPGVSRPPTMSGERPSSVFSIPESSSSPLPAAAAAVAAVQAPEPAVAPYLNDSQQRRLRALVDRYYTITGRELPTLNIQAKDFVAKVQSSLRARGVLIQDIFLNGSAATYVVLDDDGAVYNDLDFLFQLQLPDTTDVHSMFDTVRASFFDCLLEYLPIRPPGTVLDMYFLQGYVQKMFKVPNKFNGDKESTDVWSLITLNCDLGETDRHLEFKFVLRLRRGYEFSIDSLQISLLDIISGGSGPAPLMSLYGDLGQVLFHLHNKLICTHNPELVRGGGLLKYCYLVAQGYRCPDSDAEVNRLERYMCNRFLIDYSNAPAVNMTLQNYFLIRLRRQPQLRRLALTVLREVVLRCQVGDRAGLRHVIENMIYNLPHMAPVVLQFAPPLLPETLVPLPPPLPPPPHMHLQPPPLFFPPPPLLPPGPPASERDAATESTGSSTELALPPMESLAIEHRSAPASPTRHSQSRQSKHKAAPSSGAPPPHGSSPRRVTNTARRNSSDNLRDITGSQTHAQPHHPHPRAGGEFMVDLMSLVRKPRQHHDRA